MRNEEFLINHSLFVCKGLIPKNLFSRESFRAIIKGIKPESNTFYAHNASSVIDAASSFFPHGSTIPLAMCSEYQIAVRL